MVKIIWSNLAVEELKEIHDYIAKDSKIYAKREITKIRNKVSYLRDNPKIGKYVLETEEKNREIISGNFRIIYENVTENLIEILTIHHSSRDLEPRGF
ncbi:MAG: type II toxin-antitoxin system RelE/ParE family toxin [Bacteroidota bacterium]